MPYNALIRTHHITSRKKVSALKRAADIHGCFALLRSGGCPGIMYVEAAEKPAVESWVNVVRNLRYKGFQLVSRPAMLEDMRGQGREGQQQQERQQEQGEKEKKGSQRQLLEIRTPDLQVGLYEVETVKEFGGFMEDRGIWLWWRKGMGYRV